MTLMTSSALMEKRKMAVQMLSMKFTTRTKITITIGKIETVVEFFIEKYKHIISMYQEIVW